LTRHFLQGRFVTRIFYRQHQKPANTMDSVEKNHLPIICSFCCTYHLLFTEWPWLLGCANLAECLCVGTECCLKCDAEPIGCCDDSRQNTICHIGAYCCGVYLTYPTTCVRQSSQCLCLVSATVFPCDYSMPCLFTLCFCTVYPTCALCVPFGELSSAGCCGKCNTPPSKVNYTKHLAC